MLMESRELSSREREILILVLNEETSKDISINLSLSQRTVDTHRKNIAKKLGSSSLVHWTKYAIAKHWITIDDDEF